MTPDWQEHPEVREELIQAHGYYLEVGGSDLGDLFIDKMEATATLIVRWPSAAPRYQVRRRRSVVRSLRIRSFPYRLIYTARAGSILVLAYAHEKRRPGYWEHRLDR